MESGVLAGVLDQGETVLPKHIQVSDCGAVGAVTTQNELSSFVRKVSTSVLKNVKRLRRKLAPACILSPFGSKTGLGCGLFRAGSAWP